MVLATWFFTTWKFDQAITSVTYVDNDPAKCAVITIANKEKLILPVIVKVIQANGKEETINLPVEVWQGGNIWNFKYPSTSVLAQG